MNESATEELLDRLLLVSAAPATPWEDTFCVDGSGFTTSRCFAYNEERHGDKGAPRRHRWVKAIPMMAYYSKVVPAVIPLDAHAGEAPWLLPLAERTRSLFVMKQVLADKAYAKKLVYLYGQHLGIDVQIPAKSNANPSASDPGRKNRAYARKLHEYMLDPAGHRAQYGKRNSVESLMAAAKMKHDERIRSVGVVAQRNEVRLKFLVHNLRRMVFLKMEKGLEPDFRSAAWRLKQQDWPSNVELRDRFMGRRAEQTVMDLAV